MTGRRQFVRSLAAAVTAGPFLERAVRAAAPHKPAWTAVQGLIDRLVAERKVPGAVAALSFGGAATDYRAGGTLAFDSAVRVDENSIWRIYSASKPITGVAAMMLVEDGRIELEQPVAEVLPALRSPRVALDVAKGLESRPSTVVMTMRHLLTHTAGFGYWTPLRETGPLAAAYRDRGITPGNYGEGLARPGYGPQAKGLAEMVERLAELPLASEPGAVWRYSIGLDVMGAVIERVTGKAFDVFLRQRLFDPLDMRSTGFQVAPQDAARLTTNYSGTGEPLDPGATSAWLKAPTLMAGGGGLVSSARDLARFGDMLLGDGVLRGVHVMKAETARRVRSNLLPPGVTYEDGGGFGAGGRVVVGAGGRRFGPPGSFGWAGAAGTLSRIDPDRQGNLFFTIQHMPPHPFDLYEAVGAALEADLAR